MGKCVCHINYFHFPFFLPVFTLALKEEGCAKLVKHYALSKRC